MTHGNIIMPIIHALIPARGGSRGLPRKNLRLLAGKPLICHSIDAALRSRYLQKCFVSTEDQEIGAVAAASGATVIERPDALSGDRASSEDVVLHAIDVLAGRDRAPDYFVLLQPTSPLRTHIHIDDCVGALLGSGARSAISVAAAEHHPLKCLRVQEGFLQPAFDAGALHAPRQELPPMYRQNGAIYVCPVGDFMTERTFFLPPVLPFVMDAADSIDIDSAFDLECAEAVCARRQQNGRSFSFPGVPRRIGKDFQPEGLRRDTRWRLDMAAKQRESARRSRDARTSVTRCPVCESEGFETFATVFDYTYAGCVQCGHVFCRTPINAAAIAGLYAGDEERRCSQAAIYLNEELFRERVERIARPKAVFVASIVGGRGTWVDIGCGTGELLSAAQSLGWQCRGVESDPDEIEFGRRHGFEIASGFVDVSNAAALVAGAQVVSLVNILEHVLDPVGLLGAISSGIAAGGYVVCEVPRHPSLSALASQAFPELACRHIYAPDHLHVFTEASAERMLESAGLEAISVWTFGQDFWDLTNAVLTARLPGADARWRVVTDNAPSIQAAVDRAGLSDTLFMVARKR